MTIPFNGLDPAEVERLAILAEEMEEAIQAIGKILRHGYDSTHPNGGPTNKESLEKELGDVSWAMIYACSKGDLSKEKIHAWADAKAENVKPYLHEQLDVWLNDPMTKPEVA
jgi:NTP pyrophosphatase (non-canonical NTP hydrolase)